MYREGKSENVLHNQEKLLPKKKLLVVFPCLAFVLMICMIDQNGVSVALPTISADLNAQSTISWAGTSSLIANTVFSVLYGRLSDIFGRKAIFLGACGLLAIADLLCGLSQNAAMLYIFRGLAGVAGGGLTNLAMIIVSDIVSLEDRGKYQGILGAFVGLGNVIGPLVCGAFVDYSTWRGYFWLLAPIAVVSGVVALFFLPSNRPSDGMIKNLRKIDYLGCLTSSIAIIFFLIPISGGGLYFEWNSPMIISMLVIAGCASILFLWIEWKVAELPMMPVQIFRTRDINFLFLQTFILGWAYQSNLYYIPQYYQNVRGFSPLLSAAYFVPSLAMQSFTSILSGQYISRRKRYKDMIWAGFGMWTLGNGLTLLFNRDTHPAVCAVVLAIVGIGLGNIFQPTLVALQAHSAKPQRAVIISNRNLIRNTGGACGLAVSAAILQATLKQNLPPEYKYIANSVYSFPKNITGPERGPILDAYMAASRNVFILNVPIVGLGLLACFFIRDRGLQRPEEAVKKNSIEDNQITLTDHSANEESSPSADVDVEKTAK